METPDQLSTSREQRPPAPASNAERAVRPDPEAGVKLLLVSFRSGEAVERHPDVQPWLEDGWAVRSAVPRVVESGPTKLLVVLERPMAAVELTDASRSDSSQSPGVSA